MFERPASGEKAVLVQLDFGEGDFDERLSEFNEEWAFTMKADEFRRSLSKETRLPSKRRSVSSCFSPGPRKPIPPFWRSRWVQPRTSRVARCWSWASST